MLDSVAVANKNKADLFAKRHAVKLVDKGDFIGLCTHTEAAHPTLPLLDVCMPEWQFCKGLENLLKRMPSRPRPPKQALKPSWRAPPPPKTHQPPPPPPAAALPQPLPAQAPAQMTYVI